MQTEIVNRSFYHVQKHQRIDRQKIYFGFLMNYQSENTRKAYQKDLEEFFFFLNEFFPGIDEFKVEHAHVVAYKEYLIKKVGECGRELSQRTINRKIATLGAFYKHLFHENIIDISPTARIKRYKIPKEVVTTDLTDQQVDDLFANIDLSSGSGLLHNALLTLMFSTGMRHGEVTNLRMKNITHENDFTVVKYQAKGAKEMITPLNQKCLNALGIYFNWCQENGYSFEPDDHVFRPTKNCHEGNLNKKLNPNAIDYIFKKYSKLVGIKGNITAHSARSTVIGKLLDKGISIDRVADFVGHRDISTTKAYNKRKSQIKDSLAFVLD